MDTLKCLEILKLECVSSSEELKQAYRNLTRNCQPDRFRGYPRLERKAAKRLQELKLAYEHLQSYFDPGSGECLGACDPKPQKKSSLPAEKNRPVAQPAKQSKNYYYVETDNSGRESNRFEAFQAYPAKKKSPIRRLVALCFWGLLLGVVGALIYVASNWNVIASRPIGEASGAMENIVNRLAPDLTGQPKKKDAAQNNFPPVEANLQTSLK